MFRYVFSLSASCWRPRRTNCLRPNWKCFGLWRKSRTSVTCCFTCRNVTTHYSCFVFYFFLNSSILLFFSLGKMLHPMLHWKFLNPRIHLILICLNRNRRRWSLIFMKKRKKKSRHLLLLSSLLAEWRMNFWQSLTSRILKTSLNGIYGATQEIGNVRCLRNSCI